MGRHGKPVEDVIVGQSGTMAISAGGPIMRVWDLLGASTSRSGLGQEEMDEEVDTGSQYCLKALSNHQKTITSLCWAEAENGEARVLSGGLDGLVKVYDPQENWRVRHTMRYGGQILSLAVSVSGLAALPSLSFADLSSLTTTAQLIPPRRRSLGRFSLDPHPRSAQEGRHPLREGCSFLRRSPRRSWFGRYRAQGQGGDGGHEGVRGGAQGRQRKEKEADGVGSAVEGL